jgi:signal transduction histidine kinase
MFRFLALLSLSMALTWGPAAASDRGSREEAVAMVKRVEAKFQKDGPDVTFKAVTGQDGAFHDRDLYPFIYTLDGVCVAHGANPALVGKNLVDLKDQDGKFLIRELAATAKKSGGGWVDYKWPNPNTKLIEAKSSYVERIGDYFVGVGIYQQ